MAYFKIYTHYQSPDVIVNYAWNIYDGSEDEQICSYDSSRGSSDSLNLSYSLNNGWGFQIPPNDKLINRNSNYYLKIRIQLTGETSYGEYSSPVVLYCKEKPVLAFNNLSKETDNVIQMSATVFEMSYTAITEQGETLSTYKYRFYNSDKNLIDESDTYYGSITHSFSVYNLTSGETYYVQGIGTTKNGYDIDTGLYTIKIDYSITNNNYAFEVENNKSDGSIRLTSHFISITGDPNGDFSYVKIGDNNYAVDLSSGTKVTYYIQDSKKDLKDFDLKLFVNTSTPSEIGELVWQNNDYLVKGYISLHSRSFTDAGDTSEKTYATLKIQIDNTTYLIIESNYIKKIENDSLYYFIDLVCNNGFFELNVEPISATKERYQFATLDEATLDYCILGSENEGAYNVELLNQAILGSNAI